MDWIRRLTVKEAMIEMRRLWREREAAIDDSDYEELERLNLILSAVSSRIADLGGDVG
ncbi:hypothetical protein [Azospirillum brasilense]|uniref:hypothetical protein n=1 Tax=Azospirillum brasilense TaxID=192 RepID=UPI00157B507C|nr:hypothetical protein [Azospirillum brasilense]